LIVCDDCIRDMAVSGRGVPARPNAVLLKSELKAPGMALAPPVNDPFDPY
jgi:hypothetical protein